MTATISTLPSWWAQYGNLVTMYSQEYGVDPALVAGIIEQESGGAPGAQSTFTNPDGSTGHANGLMQVVGGSFDPATNIQQGIKILSDNLSRFGGNVSLALAAYNAGAGNVLKYGGIPPFPETQTYVPIVTNFYQAFQRLLNGKGGTVTTTPPLPPPSDASPAPSQTATSTLTTPATPPSAVQAGLAAVIRSIPIVGPLIGPAATGVAGTLTAIERGFWIVVGLILVGFGIYILVKSERK